MVATPGALLTGAMTFFPRPSAPVLAIATACLLLGSTGGAVAGRMITGQQIKNGTVTTKDVKDRSLRTRDLTPAAISAIRGQHDLSGTRLVSSTVTVPSGTSTSISQVCPASMTVLSAAGSWELHHDALQITYSPDLSGATAATPGVGGVDNLTIQLVCTKLADYSPPVRPGD